LFHRVKPIPSLFLLPVFNDAEDAESDNQGTDDDQHHIPLQVKQSQAVEEEKNSGGQGGPSRCGSHSGCFPFFDGGFCSMLSGQKHEDPQDFYRGFFPEGKTKIETPGKAAVGALGIKG
jgi:hypothetical protein